MTFDSIASIITIWIFPCNCCSHGISFSPFGKGEFVNIHKLMRGRLLSKKRSEKERGYPMLITPKLLIFALTLES